MSIALKSFQFTPLREGRRRLCTVRGHLLYFNSRPSARGDKSGTNQYTTQRHFNSRPSARGDVRTWSNWDGTSISIHAPPRGATRAGRINIRRKGISIHAPPRGATMRALLRSGVQNISIHAPPRGATEKLRRLMILTTYFNSRPSARGDALWQGGHAPSPISIHAPPRGATRELIKKYYTSKFQFTPLREGRQVVHKPQKTAVLFQFTPLREGRLCETRNEAKRSISIHAPPRGATVSHKATGIR